VNPVIVQCGGKVASNERKHASVIEEVPFGLMRSMLMDLVDDPVTEGRDIESDISTRDKGAAKCLELRLIWSRPTRTIHEPIKAGRERK